MESLVTEGEQVLNKNFIIRNQKVMLDRDLAELYGVQPRRLREQVKRNKIRFPDNFLFQLTEEEAGLLKVSQFATPSKQAFGGTFPYAFTEHGILMLSNVLKSERAVKMSIRIIEIFVRLREALFLHKDAALIMEQVESRMKLQDEKIETLFSYVARFLEQEPVPRAPIGYRQRHHSKDS